MMRTPHERPHARNQVDDLGRDARVGGLAKGGVIRRRREVDCPCDVLLATTRKPNKGNVVGGGHGEPAPGNRANVRRGLEKTYCARGIGPPRESRWR
jgi:hypothetical protein